MWFHSSFTTLRRLKLGAQGKDGAEGVDGDMFGNAAASQDVVRMQGEEIVRMQGEIDKLWKAQMKFVGQFNKLTAAYDEVARMQEKIINLQEEVANWIKRTEAGIE